MSGQLSRSATRSELHEMWDALERALAPLVFTSREECLAALRNSAIDWEWPGGECLPLLVERIEELADDDNDRDRTVWDLLADAVGLPAGRRARLVELSRPPQVTFGPHPWLEELLAADAPSDELPNQPPGAGVSLADGVHSTMPTHGPAPFAADVSEGKGHAIYNAHAYHTKVPHRAIMRYILHYTEPGEVVFDGFCGTGMTGVAAALCGNRREVESLGYTVSADGAITSGMSDESALGRLGTRRAVLMDLAPAVALIAAAYNSPHDAEQFHDRATAILQQLDDELGCLFLTIHSAKGAKTESNSHPAEDPGECARRLTLCSTLDELREQIEATTSGGVPLGKIRSIAWSDVFACPHCGHEFVFADAAVDSETNKVAQSFPCPQCREPLKKRDLDFVWRERAGDGRITKCVPVWIHYEWGNQQYKKRPDAWDLALVKAIDRLPLDRWYPTDRLFLGRETRRNDRRGITHVHHFYTRRNLLFLSTMREVCAGDYDLLLWFTSQLVNLSKLNRYRPDVTFPYNPLSGTLYVGSQVAESNPLIAYRHKLKKITRALSQVQADNTVICGSLSSTLLPDHSVDYIFTDPPFGGNLAYSELNFLWETWLGARTRRREEAIETPVQGKSRADYARLMKCCFRQYFRVLKPGKWMTVEFHHTQPHVWHALQEALLQAGFVIADVRTLDKQLGTFKQVTNPGAVKQDLIVSAFKPLVAPAVSTAITPMDEREIWRFVDQRLAQLPASEGETTEAGAYGERQGYLLFNRMVAYLLQAGNSIPLSAPAFYAELSRRYDEREGHFFR